MAKVQVNGQEYTGFVGFLVFLFIVVPLAIITYLILALVFIGVVLVLFSPLILIVLLIAWLL